MGKYTSLSIYKITRPWVGEVIRVTKQFDKAYKFSLGEDIRRHCIDFMMQIFRANVNQDRRFNELTEMVYVFERLHIELELAYDLGQIPQNRYFVIFKPMGEIQAQMHKWKRYAEDAHKAMERRMEREKGKLGLDFDEQFEI